MKKKFFVGLLIYGFLMFLSSFTKDTIEEFRLSNIIISYILMSISIIFLYIDYLQTKDKKKVYDSSNLVKEINKINNKYKFKNINNTWVIKEREYSRKSLNKVIVDDVIKYHIENNIDNIREYIDNSIYNKNLFTNYINEINTLDFNTRQNNTNIKDEKYKIYEDEIINNLVIKKEIFEVNIHITIYYLSSSGRVYDERKEILSYSKLIALYNNWQNGKKYEATIKEERSVMNQEIRYNVLKRDNFACKICGRTAQDGVKLHVDHIIPISEGGKTVMNNLQTLCEDCNIGKSNKTNEDFDNNLICPKCGGKLVKRRGKKTHNQFYGCSNYPTCHFIRNIKKEQ